MTPSVTASNQTIVQGIPHWLRSLSWCKLSSRALSRLVSIVISLLILSMASSALAQLQRGSQGDEVRNLQNQLTAAGCYSGPITGIFGSLTEGGVLTCQQRFGLAVDGVVGQQTMKALAGEIVPSNNNLATTSNFATTSNLATTSGDLQRGSQGDGVVALQQRLSDLGYYKSGIDGDFGRRTEEALILFQRANGLAQSGVYNAGDRAVLAAAPLPMTPLSTVAQLSVGDSGPEVERLQQQLASRKVFDAPVTGFYGSLTRNAVASFQTSQRLPITGIADEATLNALGLTGAISQASVPIQNSSTNSTNSNGNWGDRAFPTQPVTAQNSSSGRFDNVDWSQYGLQNPGQGQYVVIVPKQNGLTLAQVRRVQSGAIEGKSSLGPYFQLGAFSQSAEADRQSKILQAQGLDARVAYR